MGGEILNEVAPQGHIDDLHAPADAQNGLVGLIKGTKQLQLGLVPGHIRGIGALIFLAEERAFQIASAAQNEPVAAEIGRGAVARAGGGAQAFQGLLIAAGLPLGAGELDGERHGGAHSVSTAARAFTRVEMSSTAPSMPVVLELRVRS